MLLDTKDLTVVLLFTVKDLFISLSAHGIHVFFQVSVTYTRETRFFIIDFHISWAYFRLSVMIMAIATLKSLTTGNDKTVETLIPADKKTFLRIVSKMKQ